VHSPKLPVTYASLAPFRQWFGGGVPILTYHKLGPRPAGVRLKGLYVDAPLFDRQLAELRAAGFAGLDWDRLDGAPPAGGAGRVGISFDDGYVNVLEHGLTPLAQHGYRAIQYIVAGAIGGRNDWDIAQGEAPERLMDRAQIRAWLDAGHRIGSHTLSHARLTQLDPAAAREEIGASRRQLEDLFGVAVEHFCYPYGDWNARVRDLVVEAGYRSACTTDFGINTAQTPPFELRRIQARYRSRGLRAIRQRWSEIFR
jgi:peptidoglycan/xylan/chitin deacetylase (PgdA/CDA1 family)